MYVNNCAARRHRVVNGKERKERGTAKVFTLAHTGNLVTRFTRCRTTVTHAGLIKILTERIKMI